MLHGGHLLRHSDSISAALKQLRRRNLLVIRFPRHREKSISTSIAFQTVPDWWRYIQPCAECSGVLGNPE